MFPNVIKVGKSLDKVSGGSRCAEWLMTEYDMVAEGKLGSVE